MLAQTLLLRSQSGTALYTPKHTSAYIVIWERVLASLTIGVIKQESALEREDLNVEHAQLMLFLFHALALMQKKQVLLCAANCLIKVSKEVVSSKYYLVANTIGTKSQHCTELGNELYFVFQTRGRSALIRSSK